MGEVLLSWHTTGTQVLKSDIPQGLTKFLVIRDETDQLVKEYLNACDTYRRDQLIIGILEGELKKRRIRSARIRVTLDAKKIVLNNLLTDSQKTKVNGESTANLCILTAAIHDETKRRAEIGDGSWQTEIDEPADLWFDSGNYDTPNVRISFGSETRPAVVVDIAASVRKDPRNIGHPLVVAAIARYARRLESAKSKNSKAAATSARMPSEESPLLTNEQAEKRLDRIFAELVRGVKARVRKRQTRMTKFDRYFFSASSDFGERYFLDLAALLKESDIRRLERERLPTSWTSRIRTRLQAHMPELDHEPVLNFLSRATLPRQRTGAALRNAFDAFELNVKSASFRKYRSEAHGRLRRPAQLPINHSVSSISPDILPGQDEAWTLLMLNLGVGQLDEFIDVRSSNLVWEEFVLKSVSLPTESCQEEISHLQDPKPQ